jgi:hypothetical protein
MTRRWNIIEKDYEGEEEYRQAVTQRVIEMLDVSHYIGGMVQVAAIREQVGEDYVTLGSVVAWDSFSPAAKREPDTVPEAVAE